MRQSAKYQLLMDLISQQRAAGRRLLVFSQFATMLGLIGQGLREAGVPFTVLTGATVNRQKPVDDFQSGKVDVFLISLKAGGTGLNLTAADTVIHYDPWWNPAAQAQATDRAHRIGQTRPVFVYNLIVAGSVEERMLALQRRKRELAQGLLGKSPLSKGEEAKGEEAKGEDGCGVEPLPVSTQVRPQIRTVHCCRHARSRACLRRSTSRSLNRPRFRARKVFRPTVCKGRNASRPQSGPAGRAQKGSGTTMLRAILLFGYPGSGKGTQGKILSALPGFHHVAMGDILRALTPANPLFERVQSYLRAGNLVPDELAMDLLKNYVDQLKPDPEDFLIIDGVPRNAKQVDLLNKLFHVIRIFKLSVYDENLVVERMRKRARIQGRSDDAKDDVIARRLSVYRDETESCIRSYPGTILTRIHANQPIFDVHFDIIHALAKMRDIHFK